MIPEIFRLGSFPVNSFGLMVALAFVAGALTLARSFSRRGIDPGLAERYVMVGGLSGLIGARLWYMFEHLDETRRNFFGTLFASAGFTFYGGFLIAALSIAYLARRDRIGLLHLADSLGPTLALGYAIGRLGCQLSGDGDYGVATDSFWAMSYATGTIPTPPGVRAFVTPLFESILSLLVAIALSRFELIDRLKGSGGALFGMYLVLISIERFIVEAFRPNPILWGSFSEAQCISLGLLSLGVVVCSLAITRGNGAAT